MNIVRWLTHHPILSVWALTIVALLLSLGGTGGNKHDSDDTNSASNKHVEAEATDHHADGKDTDHQHSAENTANDASHDAQAATVATAPVNTVNNQVKTAVTAVSVPANNAVIHADVVDTGTTNVVVTEVETTTLAVEVSPTESSLVEQQPLSGSDLSNKSADVVTTTLLSVEVIPADSTLAEQQPLSSNDLSDKSVDDLLLMAREAYWNNGLDEAASIYLQLIQLEPHVVEHKGELGNVYWSQGFPEKSASLYAAIAIPMIDKGNAERVSNMIGFIGLFHPNKAAEINKHMQKTAE